MKRLIDCFTFNNVFDMLELRLKEISSVVDKFLLVEANSTFKGDAKPFYFDENKERYKEWQDKIIHVKCIIPDTITDAWGRERYQRNSFMTSLYYLGLNDNDLVMITDVDEIPNFGTISYIKNGYPHDLGGLYKLEMTTYIASIYNKLSYPKWYHPKIVDWANLKTRTPDSCRSDFNCQWWENGGWHLSYFGGPSDIENKINSFSHQEFNRPEFKKRENIIERVKNGEDIFNGEVFSSGFELIDPYENPDLPKNWRVLEKFESIYRDHKPKKDLVICAAIRLGANDTKNFIRSFRKYNTDADIYCIIESDSSKEKMDFLESNGVKLLFTDSIKFIKTQPNNTRFMKISDFLKENSQGYNNVLLSDISDVVFQSDPFANLHGDFIISPEEDEDKTIEIDQRFNSRWIRNCFGESVYEELKSNKILCCGTVIGSMNNIKIYVDNICAEMFTLYQNGSEHFHDMMDQGIHNYLFYKKPEIFKNPIIKKNGDYIATVGITTIEYPSKIKYLDDKIEVNGLIPSIVHQYNRSNDMINLYNRLHMEDHQIITNTIDSGSLNNTTIVTALYDLNRESWDGFNRKFDTYKGWMAHMLSFDSPMVIYVDPSDVDFVSNNRRGKEDITRIVPLPFTQISTYKKYGERIREVMGSESFLLNQTVPEHPQIKFPDYNILMHQKIQFVNDASIINYFNTDYFMWLDAGVYHMNNRVDLLGKKFPTINLNEEKMYFLHIDEPKESDLDLERFYKGHNVRIIGTSWLGHKNAINKFTLEYENLIEESLSKNLMDQDQSFFTVCYLRNKHICDTNQGTWKSAIDFWG